MSRAIVSESEPIGIQIDIGKKNALEGMVTDKEYTMDTLGPYKMNALQNMYILVINKQNKPGLNDREFFLIFTKVNYMKSILLCTFNFLTINS